MLTLTQQDDDDDDNHLCIKCNVTIVGLDNYVQHRKNNCGKRKQFQTNTDHNQDVFFQSLELHSTKRPTVQQDPILPQTSSKNIGGVLTRRATAAIIATKEIYNSSDIVSEKRGEDWIGGHSLKVAECDDNQTKLIKAVDNISGVVKKEHINPSFTMLDYKDDSNEESDDLEDIDMEEHPHTGGKWKPSTTPTGGKWKPSYSGRYSAPHWSTVTPEPDQIEDWEEEHTGGKWKPIITHSMNVLKMPEIEEEEEDAYMPPPGHTKGKWIPGAKDGMRTDHKTHIMDATALHKEGCPVQYWCGPCNRRLGSRHIYEKHLMSKLHLKRTLPEKDLEYSGMFKNRIEEAPNKRTIKLPRYLDENFYFLPRKSMKKSRVEKSIEGGVKKRRKRLPNFIHCLVCRYRVKPFLLGKHLISHYHFRKGDLNDEFNKIQILDNIDKIVRQSPFQCSPCKFYANWQAEFMRHWRTKAHKENMENFAGRYWCSFCKFECEEYTKISEHLTSDEHQEVVAAINRSIPIIIRKKTVINCTNCGKEFKYNAQLRRHIKLHCTMITTSTASDEYQGRKRCNQCPASFKTRSGLFRHVNKKHDSKLYYCSACSMQFSSYEEAKNHRRFQYHRIKSQELRRDKGFESKELSKDCPHCDATKFKNVLELKQHIEESHKDAFSSCSRCGMKFAFPQEIAWHLRKNACSFENPASTSNTTISDNMWTCQYCPFSTTSYARCLYHEVLHGKPSKDKQKYICPICQRLFPKHYLLYHLRSHTNERVYPCNLCETSFYRKSNLTYHLKTVHKKDKPNDGDEKQAENTIKQDKSTKSTKHFLCAECGVSFKRRFSFVQHQTVHSGRRHACTFKGCHHMARNPSELKLHLKTHSNKRPFQCSECDYAAKTKTQLKRHVKLHSDNNVKDMKCSLCKYKTNITSRLTNHMRLHTLTKPFFCRFCPFTCNKLENLRKHVLNTQVHQNKFLYECENCTEKPFKTNFAKEFRAHLLVKHPTIYSDKKAAEEYTTRYLMHDEQKSDESAIATQNKNSNVEVKQYLHTDDGILGELPSEDCYSVTESGTLVPYLDQFSPISTNFILRK